MFLRFAVYSPHPEKKTFRSRRDVCRLNNNNIVIRAASRRRPAAAKYGEKFFLFLTTRPRNSRLRMLCCATSGHEFAKVVGSKIVQQETIVFAPAVFQRGHLPAGRVRHAGESLRHCYVIGNYRVNISFRYLYTRPRAKFFASGRWPLIFFHLYFVRRRRHGPLPKDCPPRQRILRVVATARREKLQSSAARL